MHGYIYMDARPSRRPSCTLWGGAGVLFPHPYASSIKAEGQVGKCPSTSLPLTEPKQLLVRCTVNVKEWVPDNLCVHTYFAYLPCREAGSTRQDTIPDQPVDRFVPVTRTYLDDGWILM